MSVSRRKNCNTPQAGRRLHLAGQGVSRLSSEPYYIPGVAISDKVVAMPMFFFQVLSTDQHIDPEGSDLPDLEAAWRTATKSAGELLRELDGNLKPGEEWRLNVTDESGNAVFDIRIDSVAHVPFENK
jgi:hypothetical protein